MHRRRPMRAGGIRTRRSPEGQLGGGRLAMNLDQGSRTQESDPAAGVGACDAEGAVRHGTAPPLDGLSQRELATQLEIHRVELEVQNQQLREMQASLERARHRYFTLFDISPVGYFVVNRAGLVFELNLRAAEMAGLERARLLFLP